MRHGPAAPTQPFRIVSRRCMRRAAPTRAGAGHDRWHRCEVLYAGGAPQTVAGLFQLNVKIPAGPQPLPNGRGSEGAVVSSSSSPSAECPAAPTRSSIILKPMAFVALTIAGSDPSGGAGLQADLKTFHQFGVYGEAVVTLLTVQNTVRVSRVEVMD